MALHYQHGPYLAFGLLHLVPCYQRLLISFKPPETTRSCHGYLSTSLKTLIVVNVSTTALKKIIQVHVSM